MSALVNGSGTGPARPRPEVTIVIPTKDRIADVRRAIGCALGQRGADVEVVVVDDGSRIAVADACADLRAQAGRRLRIVRNHVSRGVARARNLGIAHAEAPWVGFCDDDDMWAPTKVRHHLDAAGADTGWTGSGAVKVDERLHILQRQPAPDPAGIADTLLAANVVGGGASSVIARTSLLRDLGGFDPAFSTLADWDLWVRLAAAAPLAVVDRPLVAYVVQAASMSADTRLLWDDLGRFIVKHEGARRGRGVAFDQGNWERYVADMHLRAGDRLGAAWRYAAAARRGRPSSWKLAPLSLVHPDWTRERLYERRRRQTPPAWIDEAETWITPLRPLPTPPDGTGREVTPVVATGRPGARPAPYAVSPLSP